MKNSMLLSVVALMVFTLCLQSPADAGNVTVINNCAQDVNYDFRNNAYMFGWKMVGRGVVAPGYRQTVNTDDIFSCVILVKLSWLPQERFIVEKAWPISGSWRGYASVDAQAKQEEHCPVNGCLWLQCGSATYSFNPVGTPANPVDGSTRKCNLTISK